MRPSFGSVRGRPPEAHLLNVPEALHQLEGLGGRLALLPDGKIEVDAPDVPEVDP